MSLFSYFPHVRFYLISVFASRSVPEPSAQEQANDQNRKPYMTETAKQDHQDKQYRAQPEQAQSEDEFCHAPREADPNADDSGQKHKHENNHSDHCIYLQLLISLFIRLLLLIKVLLFFSRFSMNGRLELD